MSNYLIISKLYRNEKIYVYVYTYLNSKNMLMRVTFISRNIYITNKYLTTPASSRNRMPHTEAVLGIRFKCHIPVLGSRRRVLLGP